MNTILALALLQIFVPGLDKPVGADIAGISAVMKLVIAGELPQATTPPINPSEIAFTSPDHAIITDYEIGFFLVGAVQPVQVNKQAKPGISSDGDVHLSFNSRPLGLGVYELKVRAYAGTTVGDWSTPAGFSRALSPLGNPRIVR